MPRQREIMVGRRDRFAVKVAFLPDPDDGEAARPEESLAWGSLEIWVNGDNLCAHLECGEPFAGVHWYLLSFLEWLTSNWDFLLHEERLPAKNAAGDAWMSTLRTSEPPGSLTEEESESWELNWHAWWQRHCLLACRDGGLFPTVFIRRWRDLIEFSWGNRPLAGAPDHFRFAAQHGYARLDPAEVASVLYSVLEDAASHLLSEMQDSPVLQQLVDDISRLRTSDHRRRLGLLSGYRIAEEPPENQWQELEAIFPPDMPSGVRHFLFGMEASGLVVTGGSPAALMFGSLAPTINQVDARALAAKLVQYCRPDSESAALHNLVRDIPVQQSEEAVWEEGYQLATSVLDAMHLQGGNSHSIDIDAVYQTLGIVIDSIELHDRSIRAVAIAGTEFCPSVLLNTRYEFLEEETRRFTLAHELCHILHDRGYRAQLAMASGPWAPVDVEKRANAFAAMFLMPRELLGATVRGLTQGLETPSAVWTIANVLRTSYTSTLEHLCNLGFIGEGLRDSLRIESRPSQTA